MAATTTILAIIVVWSVFSGPLDRRGTDVRSPFDAGPHLRQTRLVTPIEEDPAVAGPMVDRLAQHFPGTQRDHITETVRDGYRALSDNPIRAYIPNLVEHGARTRLRREARSAGTAA